MAAPLGNNNAGKSKDWEEALRQELLMYENKDKGIERKKALRAIARVVIEKALEGSPNAYAEIGNRLDGKAHQSVTSESTVTLNIAQQDEAVLSRYLPKVVEERTYNA